MTAPYNTRIILVRLHRELENNKKKNRKITTNRAAYTDRGTNVEGKKSPDNDCVTYNVYPMIYAVGVGVCGGLRTDDPKFFGDVRGGGWFVDDKAV